MKNGFDLCWKQLVVTLLCGLAAVELPAQAEAQAGDEVRMEHRRDSTRSATVVIGEPMRVWTTEHKRHTAKLKAVKDTSFVIGEVEIPVASVVKVKAFSKEMGSRRMKSQARRSAWTFVGGVGLAVLGLLIALLAGAAGRTIAILAIALGLGTAAICLLVLAGVLVALMGGNIPATSFPMDKGWRLKLVRKKP